MIVDNAKKMQRFGLGYWFGVTTRRVARPALLVLWASVALWSHSAGALSGLAEMRMVRGRRPWPKPVLSGSKWLRTAQKRP